MKNHNHIECPNCGTSFELNKNNFANILSQVKEIEIDKQVSEKVKIFKDILFSFYLKFYLSRLIFKLFLIYKWFDC